MENTSERKPLISVIMSVYNESPEMLQKAMISILEQTYTNFEFIIVIDNPQETILKEIIYKSKKADSRIKVIENKNNIGLAESLNKAINISQGKYIARMDADDISFKERLEKQLDFLEKNRTYDVVYSTKLDINIKGEIVSFVLTVPKSDILLWKSLSYGSMIVHPSVLMRAEQLKEVGCYNNLYTSQDYDLWVRMRMHGCRFHCIEEPLLYYRVRNNSITTTKSLIQYLSLIYIKTKQKHDCKFDLKEYKKFIRDNQYNGKLTKHYEMYSKALREPIAIKLIKIIILTIIDQNCRRRTHDLLCMKQCMKKIALEK